MSSTSATPPLTTWQLVKMTGPIILFGILLPTVDNLTDLRMIIRLYFGIPGCKSVYYVYYEDYISMNGTNWQDLYTCQQDSETYCQLNPNSVVCKEFEFDESKRKGYPGPIPNCTWDLDTCEKDPATFCEDNPHRLICGHYRHRDFALMFLGM